MSNDLISRSALLEEMKNVPPNAYTPGQMIYLAKNAPTAYDVDNVVGQLKNYAIEFEAFGQCSDYVELSHAVGIVKGGGVNE